MRSTAIALAFLALWQTSEAATLHVPGDYPSIQQALNAATSGDDVLVGPGTYLGNLIMSSAQDGVILHSASGPGVTILDGNGASPVLTVLSVGPTTEISGFTITHPGLSQFFTNIGAGINLQQASPKISGNVLVGNDVTGAIYVTQGSPWIVDNDIHDNQAPHGSGGGIYFDHFSNGKIENNTFTNNHAAYKGGALAIWEGSAPLVTGNHFTLNQADAGGGAVLVTRGSSPTLSNNEFRGNDASLATGGAIEISLDSHPLVQENQIIGNTGGGAIYINGLGGAHPTIEKNLIEDNECPHGSGGGIYVDNGATPLIRGNVIARNHCVAWGGGITIWSYSAPTLSGNTIVLNKADLGGGNVHLRRGAYAALDHNILSHSPNDGLDLDFHDDYVSATLSCNDVSDNAGGNYTGLADPTGTNGNISSDPLFCDLMALDVHLSSVSPCTAANAPAGCDLIGALDVGCEGPVRTENTTWGGLKARYR